MTKLRISGVAVDSCLQPRDSAADVSPLGSQWADRFNAALKIMYYFLPTIVHFMFVFHMKTVRKILLLKKKKKKVNYMCGISLPLCVLFAFEEQNYYSNVSVEHFSKPFQ